MMDSPPGCPSAKVDTLYTSPEIATHKSPSFVCFFSSASDTILLIVTALDETLRSCKR